MTQDPVPPADHTPTPDAAQSPDPAPSPDAAPTPDAAPAPPAAPPDPVPPRRSLARWFWGGIGLMLVLTLALVLLAMRAMPPAEPPAPPPPAEMSPADLGALLDSATARARAEAEARIDPLLDAAYAPAYAAIPAYADFHYSVYGEYAELASAALGEIGVRLQETLFSGLDDRLAEVARGVDVAFATTYDTAAAPAETALIGAATRRALDGATDRMRVTVPVAGAVAVTGKAAVAAMAKVMAKKIGAKLAVKAAAKGGGKLAAATGGAGVGAAACSWAGPGAGLCALAGGVGAWLIADYGIVKLDEFWSRADFEADLRQMVDDQKADHRAALVAALEARTLGVRAANTQTVVEHDLTLREMAGHGTAEVCETVAQMAEAYAQAQGSLRARTPDALAQLRARAQAAATDPALVPLADEVRAGLGLAELLMIDRVTVAGNLPTDDRANRKLSGRLTLGETFDLAELKADEDTGFRWDIAIGRQAPPLGPGASLPVSLSLHQHLRLRDDRYYSGAGVAILGPALGAAEGLTATVTADLPLARDEDAGDIMDVAQPRGTAAVVSATLSLRAEPLPPLTKLPTRCDAP